MSLSTIKDFFRGFCLGVANIIPGVSGGTFLLIFGIYQRVFSILTHINRQTIFTLVRMGISIFFLSGRKERAKAFWDFLEERDFPFLIRLGIGAAVAILVLSSLMKYLLIHQFIVTYALFFGLITVSLVIPFRLLKTWSPAVVLLIFLGTVATMGVSWGVNPYEKIKFKSDRLALEYHQADHQALGPAGDGAAGTGGQNSAGTAYALKDYLYIGLAGAIAISATVLPGISGALVLILMGAYFDVIAAISALQAMRVETLAFLSAFALGIICGGLLFARLVSFVFNRYYNATMAFLTGLMLGSLYALWPFKQVVVMARQYVKENGVVAVMENVPVYTNINRLPGGDDPVLFAWVAFVAGCLIMAAFVRKEAGD